MNAGPVTDPHWWAQPIATIVAAVIALIAAGVAWLGATSQSREANRRDRVTNRIEALAGIQAAVLLIIRTGVTLRHVEDNAENRQAYTLAIGAALVDKIRLIALGGYDTAEHAADEVMTAVTALTNSPDDAPSTDEVSDKLASLTTAIADAVRKEDGKKR